MESPLLRSGVAAVTAALMAKPGQETPVRTKPEGTAIKKEETTALLLMFAYVASAVVLSTDF